MTHTQPPSIGLAEQQEEAGAARSPYVRSIYYALIISRYKNVTICFVKTKNWIAIFRDTIFRHPPTSDPLDVCGGFDLQRPCSPLPVFSLFVLFCCVRDTSGLQQTALTPPPILLDREQCWHTADRMKPALRLPSFKIRQRGTFPHACGRVYLCFRT